MAIDDQRDAVGKRFKLVDFGVPMVNVIEFFWVNAVLDVILNKLVLYLFIGEVPAQIPENEGADWVLSQDGVKQLNNLVGIPDKLPLDCREEY